jgi:hypothetical protein
MQHLPASTEDNAPANDLALPSTEARALPESELPNELAEARHALRTALNQNERLTRLVADARELLVDAQERIGRAEARASQAESRAQIAEAELNRLRSPELKSSAPHLPLDFYTNELNRLRALIDTDEKER